ncbi:DUF2249 domain-containing protein [Microbispora sp. H13382]|uniref:DUF2249 domain-containing protein n=1 Tax=Microbispora sp. H13382 TaxID=2729112 RepID=UPI0037C9C6D2
MDVREIPHGQRHPRIFARYAHLAPGEAFILVNNHDPKPLRGSSKPPTPTPSPGTRSNPARSTGRCASDGR